MTQQGDPQIQVRDVVSLHVPCHYSYLRILRQSVVNMCIHSGFSEFQAAELEMAMDEAGAFILSSLLNKKTESNETKSGSGLHVELKQYKDRIVVEIHHPGSPLDIFSKAAQYPAENDLSDLPENLSCLVIQRFVDDVVYFPLDETTQCLQLTKHN